MTSEIFDPLDYPEPTPAIEELKRLNQWVAWRYVTRPGATKPTKPPVDPRTGRGASHSNPSTWNSYDKACWRAKVSNLAGIGFVLSEDDGYTGVDLDRCVNKETGEIAEWALEILELAETYAEFSPSRTGIRMFVRGKVEKATKCNKAGVEIYGRERYMTVTGWHIDDTPDDICLAPKTLAALLARVEAFSPKDMPEIEKPAAPPSSGSVVRQPPWDAGARAWAQKALEGKAADLAATGEGGRNHALNASAYGMGRMVARGWIAESEVVRSLTDACKTNGLWKEDGPKGVRATLMSGLRSGLQNPHEDLPERDEDAEVAALADAIGRKLAESEDGTLHDAETGEIVETTPASREDFPTELTRPPGLVGEIVEWILDTSANPSFRSLALATALTTVGAVCGRYWCGPSRAGTALYAVILGPTGSGKEHFLQAPRRILLEAGLETLIGPGAFMSQSAIQNFVRGNPVSLCPQDEFGELVRRMTSKRASSFESGMMSELRTLWGMNFGSGSTSAKAASKGEHLWAISMSMLCAGTHEEFWNALDEGALVNGFLNRFLLFPMGKLLPSVEPKISELDPVPASIINGLHKLHCGGYKTESDMSQHCLSIDATLQTWVPVMVKWDNESVKDNWYAYRGKLNTSYPEGHSSRPFYVRTAENALRIATIIALGKLEEAPVVREEDVRFGIMLAEWAARAMQGGAATHMAETDHQKYSSMVMRIIMANGGEATWRTIHQKMKNRISTGEIKKVLETMLEGDYIYQIKDPKRPSGGHRTSRYKLGKIYD